MRLPDATEGFWPFNPGRVWPRLEGSGAQGSRPHREPDSVPQRGFCNGRVAAHRRAPAAKPRPRRVARDRWSAAIVFAASPPRRRAWRRLTANRQDRGGTGPPARRPCRTEARVKTPEFSPLTNAALNSRPAVRQARGLRRERVNWSMGGSATGRESGSAGRRQRAAGGVAPPPAGGDQPALEVLPGGTQERLRRHLREAA